MATAFARNTANKFQGVLKGIIRITRNHPRAEPLPGEFGLKAGSAVWLPRLEREPKVGVNASVNHTRRVFVRPSVTPETAPEVAVADDSCALSSAPLALWRELLRFGLSAARRHIPPCDQEDCALEFAYHFLAAHADGETDWETAALRWTPPYYCRCAHNYACTYGRRLRHRLARCLPLYVLPGEEESAEGDTPRAATPRLSERVRHCNTSPPDALWQGERDAAVWRAVARLSDAQRAAFLGCAVEGETALHVSARLGVSETAISSALARARRALQAHLAKEGYAPEHLTRWMSEKKYLPTPDDVGLRVLLSNWESAPGAVKD